MKLFEKWKNNARLKELDAKIDIKERELFLNNMENIVESSKNNLIVDEDLENGFFLNGSFSSGEEQKHRISQQKAYEFYHDNLYARAIIRSLVKFVMGVGPMVQSKEEKNKKEVDKLWKEFKENNKWNTREKEICTRMFRDGEFFLRIFKPKRDIEPQSNESYVNVRFIRPNLIANPENKKLPENVSYGIKTNPDDIEEPITYYKINSNGDLKEAIPADEIIHIKIFSDSDQKRGISILRVCAKRLTQYEGWMNDRIILNKIRTAIALHKKITGSAKTVTNIRNKNKSSRKASNSNKTGMFGSGSIITSGAEVEYEMLSPNINATDVKDDGRAMLLSISAGIGFPEMLLTADYSNANYSSSLIAQNPFVREIEDWQDFLVPFYKDLFKIVIQEGIDSNKLSKDTSTDCEVEFPPMIQSDLLDLTKAYEILYKYKIVSRKTWRGKAGFDPEMEDEQVKDEEGDELYNPDAPVGDGNNPIGGGKSQFNLPRSPINQYAHKIAKKIKNGELKTEKEIEEYLINGLNNDNI